MPIKMFGSVRKIVRNKVSNALLKTSTDAKLHACIRITKNNLHVHTSTLSNTRKNNKPVVTKVGLYTHVISMFAEVICKKTPENERFSSQVIRGL